MALNPAYQQEINKKASKPLMWVGIVSIIMLFAGFTSGYVVSHSNGEWLYFEIPSAFYISTILIILSSISLIFAFFSAKKNLLGNVKIGLGATLLLGLAFIYYQFQGYGALVNANVYFTGPTANSAGSYFYIITGLHLMHLVGGIIAAIVTFINSIREKYTAQNNLGLQVFSIYWHFLGVLWVYLLIFLILVR